MTITLIMAAGVGAGVGAVIRGLIPAWRALPWWLCALVGSAAAAGGDLAVRAVTGDVLNRPQELLMQALFGGVGALTMGTMIERQASANGRSDPSAR